MSLIGLRLPAKTSNRNNQSSKDCGSLWQRFEQEKIAGRIPGKLDGAVCAVYFNYEGDHTRPFDYFIGCRVAPGTAVPEGLDSLEIPEQRYTYLLARGEMPACIANAWREVWNSNLPRSYTYDLEVYDERSHDWSHAEVDLFVAMK